MENKKVIFLIVIVLIFLIIFSFKDKLLTIIYPRTYNEIVEKYAKEYNIQEDFILAVIKAESNFDNKIKSHKGAIGLMQIMEDTAIEIASKEGLQIDESNVKEKLLNPDININIGTKYLQELIEKYDNIELALTAYNAGTGNVNKWIEDGIIKKDGSNIEKVPFKETNKYVRTILRNYRIYREIYQNNKAKT